MKEINKDVKCDECGNDTFYAKVIEGRGVEVTLKCTKYNQEQIYNGG